MELSNSSKKFWDYLLAKQISRDVYKSAASRVGAALLELVESWHADVSIERGGNIDISKSSYLVLSYNRDHWYQLHQFPLKFPAPGTINWTFSVRSKGEAQHVGNLRGYEDEGMLF